MLQLAVFASGKGSNLEAIYRSIESGSLHVKLALVVSNNSNSGALQFAKEKGIYGIHLSLLKCGNDEKKLEDEMLGLLQSARIDLIALAGYMKKLPKGVLEKYVPGDYEFDLPTNVVEAARRKDFGQYIDKAKNDLVVCFITTNDITGGNSGSPVLNGNGEQVGIVFDGNFEGLGNDFYYDPDVNRTIACDIRYVLFVTEKFSGAKWVVDEMKIVGSAKAKAAAAGAAVSKFEKLEKQDDRLTRKTMPVY